MTLVIRRSPYVTGSTPPVTYQVQPDEVLGHLIVLATGGEVDELPAAFSEDSTSDPDWATITFTVSPAPDTSTPKGRVQQRMLDIVASSNEFQIIGVDESTVWSDGETTAASPARTLGRTVFYAVSVCNGNGRWVIGSGGGQPCTPVVGILYHELAHAFHGHPVGTVAQDEAEAITDENELRTQMGFASRSTSDLRSECGCSGDSGCCIIASVSTGAPYGREVNALRFARDHFFRSTAVGDAFFAALHREYYSFSIDVCRVMVCSEPARREVERVLVRPLVAALRFFRMMSTASTEAERAQAYRDARAEILAVRGAESPLDGLVRDTYRGEPLRTRGSHDSSIARIEQLLAARLPSSPHVAWAIGGPLALFLDSLEQIDESASDAEVDAWWRPAMDAWLRGLPMAAITELPAAQWTRELAELFERVSPDPERRAGLLAHLRQRGGCA